MKKIVIVLLLACFGMGAKAQFPTMDSLRNFTNRYIRNSAVEAFQNLRLNTVLNGLSRFGDSSIKNIYRFNDSTFKYVTTNNDTFSVVIRGAGGSGGGGGSFYDSVLMASTKRLVDSMAAVRSTVNGKQNTITLTTTGTSGAATFNQSTGELNIPNYATSGGSGTVTSVAIASGTAGTDVNITGSPVTSSGTITVNIPDASTSSRGLITALTQQIGGSKIFTGTYTPSSKLAYAIGLTGELTATANNDTLAALEIKPTYTIGSFTGVRQMGIRNPVLDNLIGHIRGFSSTGNIVISSAASTATDAGYKLDVNGTARISGTTTLSSSLSVGTTVTAQTVTVTNTIGITGGGVSIGTTTADFLQSSNSTYLTRLWDKTSAGSLGELLRLYKSPAATVSNGTGTYVSAFNNNQPGGGNKTIGDFTFWQKNPTSTSVEGIFEISLPYQINTSTSKITNTIFRANGIGVVIGSQTNHTGGSDAPASAALEVRSTTQGLLPPRMTGAQVEAISSPVEGLMVYATSAGVGAITSKGWWGFDGTTWVKLN